VEPEGRLNLFLNLAEFNLPSIQLFLVLLELGAIDLIDSGLDIFKVAFSKENMIQLVQNGGF